jgi:hypothetical protein
MIDVKRRAKYKAAGLLDRDINFLASSRATRPPQSAQLAWPARLGCDAGLRASFEYPSHGQDTKPRELIE